MEQKKASSSFVWGDEDSTSLPGAEAVPGSEGDEDALLEQRRGGEGDEWPEKEDENFINLEDDMEEYEAPMSDLNNDFMTQFMLPSNPLDKAGYDEDLVDTEEGEDGEEEDPEEAVPEDAVDDNLEIILPSPQKLSLLRHSLSSLASTSQALPPSEQEFQEAVAEIQDFVRGFKRCRSFHKAAEKWTEEDRDWNNAKKR